MLLVHGAQPWLGWSSREGVTGGEEEVQISD